MLNPAAGEPEITHNIIENKQSNEQFSFKSPMSDKMQQHFHLLPIQLEQPVPAHYQTIQPYHFSPVNPSVPQSPHSTSYPRQPFTPAFSRGYPTPLLSNPHHHFPRQPEHHVPSDFTARHQKFHVAVWKPTALPSPRQHIDDQQVQDTYWHSPQYHNRPRTTTDSRPGTNRVTKPPKRGRQGQHSNKAYTVEQVHWLRYHREDLQLPWPQVHAYFSRCFPDTERLTESCLSSRYYRNNVVPKLDGNGGSVLDSNGKVVMIPAKVRDRVTTEGKMKPFLFVDKHPEFALVYDWVKQNDKTRATTIVKGLEERTDEASGKFLY